MSVWEQYLNTTFDSDEMRLALQMLFGYILSGETRFKVGFFWIGQGGEARVQRHIFYGSSWGITIPAAFRSGISRIGFQLSS